MNKLIMMPLLCSSFLFLLACGSNKTNSKTLEQEVAQANTQKTISQSYCVETIAQFNEPWAITSLPDQQLLITERK